jgi:hypothetical protein
VLFSASFGSMTSARVAHKDAPHHLGSEAEELCTIFPVYLALVNKPEVNIVHQGGGLKRVTGGLATEKAHGLPVQFIIDQRHQFLERWAITALPSHEQSRDFIPGGGRHRAFSTRRKPFTELIRLFH